MLMEKVLLLLQVQVEVGLVVHLVMVQVQVMVAQVKFQQMAVQLALHMVHPLNQLL